MWYRVSLIDFVRNYLPLKAEFITLKKPAVFMADLDGDGILEIIAAYKWQGENYIIIMKNYNNIWYVVANIKGKGYDLNYLNIASITSKRTNNLIIGWQIGSIWSLLNIYEWTAEGIKNILKENMYYSKIEVEDMPGKKGRDGKAEIALWNHITGEAYEIEVYRWTNGRLEPALDVYPYYFRRVVPFYEQRVKESPQAAFYWYCLADAQLKAEMPERALKSVHIAMDLAKRFNYDYPSREDMLKLEQKALSNIKNRTIKLHLAPVKTVNGVKWGYIDNKGNFVIKPKYDFAYDFAENGIAIVEEKNLYGIIDQLGKYVLQPKYDSINEFSEGRAAAVQGDIFKVIDENGKELTTKPYIFIGSFKEGRAVMAITDKQGKSLYGYLDREGKEAVPPKFEYVGDFNNGKAVVKISDNQYALIDFNGDILKNYKYAFVGELGDGLLAFKQRDDGKFGYMDVDGNVVIQPRYTGAQPFSEGRAVVNVSENYGNNYGLIDKKGNYIIMPQYNDINLLGDNRVAAGRAIDKDKPYMGSKFAIGDTDGKLLTDFIYNGVSNYKEGFASAFNDEYTFFIEKNGKIAKNLPMVGGSGTLNFEGNLIKVDVDHRISYLDKAEKVIWSQNTIIPLNKESKVKEEKYKPNRDYLVYYPQIQGMKDITAQNSVNNKLKELSQVKPIDSNVQLDYNYFGDFNVELFKKNLLVLELEGYNYPIGAAHGMPTKIYAHVDLESGKLYELKDLFKKNSNYVKVLSDIIEKQIKNNKEYSYVWLDSYKGIKEDQPFYVTEDALYIYFYPYDIAPYAAGFPTFKIPFEDIMSIIDVNGEFWKSFH